MKVIEVSTMMNYIIGGIFLLLSLFIGLYTWNFHEYEVSDNPEQWGQFGDYIGGTINTTVAILNFILITYITLRIAKNEENRAQNSFKDSVRPLALFYFDIADDFLSIQLHNVGLGPLILKEFSIFDAENQYKDLKEIIDTITIPFKPEHSITKSTIDDGTIIRKDDYLNLLTMKIDDGGMIEYTKKVDCLNQIKARLAKLEIKIVYADLFGNVIKEESEKLAPISTVCT